MSHSNSGSDLGPELTYFNPSLGALHIPHKGTTFLTTGTGWGADGGRGYLFGIMAFPCFTESYSSGVVKLRTL